MTDHGPAAQTPVRLRSHADYVSCIPVHVVWEITLACNLRCAHCGSRAGAPRKDELSTSEALKLVEHLAALGAREVTLIGGEAYLRRDWLEIIRAVRLACMKCSLQTGGRALTDDKIEAAARAGLNSAGVSIDGLAPVHDKLRGVPGSFNQAISALKSFGRFGIETTVNTQITAVNIHDLSGVLSLIADAGAVSWQVQLTVAMGNAADNPDILVQPYQLLEIMPLLAKLYDEAEDVGVRLLPGNNIGYFGPYEYKWRSISDVTGHWQGCSAGQTTIGIEADGTIKGCPSLPTSSYAGGNIRNMSLTDIWQETPELSFVRQRSVDSLWGYCRSCYYSDICMGGCTWTSHSLFGRPGNNPYCHYRTLKLAEQGLRERVRRVSPPAGHPFDHGIFEIILETSTGDAVRVEQPEPDFRHNHEPLRAGYAPQQLSICEACLQFVTTGTRLCPHCGQSCVELVEDHTKNNERLRLLMDNMRATLEDLEKTLSCVPGSRK